jgi:hypothetical protein
VARDDVRERAVAGLRCEAAPDLHRQSAVGGEHARHLPKRTDPIGEVHERRLTEHDVEGRRLEGKARHVGAVPLELRPDAPRDLEHALVQVDTGDSAAATQPVGGFTSDDARPTGDIEHRLPRLRVRGVQQVRRPFAEQGGDELSLVQLGRLRRQLKGLGRLAHGPPPRLSMSA